MIKCNVISHRGSNRIAPQNTLPAFRKSIQYGVDGFETDVHLTSDGVPVIHHNYEIDKTSNGKGEIVNMTLESLKELEFGSYFHPSFRGTKMPTLEEFLTLCETANLKILNIEIKPPLNKDYKVVPMVLDAVKAHGLFDELLISSFDPQVLTTVKDIDESCRTGILYCPNKLNGIKYFKHAVEIAKDIRADALHPHKSYITEKYVAEAHNAGLEVNPWTLDTEREIRHAIKCGVDGVITDVPNVAQKVIAELNNEE